MRRETGPAFPAEFGGHAASEIIGQHLDIAFAHAQRRQGDDLETQPVEQVGAKLALLRLGREVLVGRADDPHVDAHRAA